MINTPRIKLGDLAKVVTKGTTPTSIGSGFVESGIPFLRINNIDNGLIDFDKILFIDEQTHNHLLRRSIIQPGDFLITIAGTIGKTLVVPDEAPAMNCNQAIAIIRLNSGIDKNYLKFWLATDDAHRQVSGAKVTATISNLSLGQIKELEIPLPPLEEQKRIAAILDKADTLRRKRQQAIELADQFLRSVFLDMFGDPVTNPNGWPFSKLADATLKIGSGATPRGGKAAYVESGVSLVRSMNIHDDKFLHKGLAHINDTQADALSNVIVEAHDVLLNITGASVCRCAKIDTSVLPARVNQHVCILRTEKEILEPNFLLHLLISAPFKRDLLHLAGTGGATREALTKDQVSNLQIPIPPIDLQIKFSKLVEKVSKNKFDSLLAQQSARNFFDSASQSAFKGELTQSKSA